MLKIEKRLNQNNGPEIGIKTNEGEFIISKENGDLYIGCFEKNVRVPATSDNKIEFKITKEDKGIYKIFSDFFKGICLQDEEDVIEKQFSSDDYVEELSASTLTIKNNIKDETISFIFEKSKSNTEYNSYFVKFEDIDIPTEIHYVYLIELLDELLIYTPTFGQITIDELLKSLNIIDEGYTRSRKNSRINQ